MRTRLFVSLCAVLSFATACGGGGNDHGGSGAAQCNDGVDNDGDGKIDFPDDPGCTSAEDNSEDSPPAAQCNDGRDNDGDGKIDYPNDPGCFSPTQNDETDDCPDGPGCPQCANGKDDDGNGKTDYPADPGCTSAADTTELFEDVAACSGILIKNLPMSGSVDDTLTADMLPAIPTNGCNPAAMAPAIAYEVHLDSAKVITATTSNSDPSFDTMIDIRGMGCTTTASEVACNDNTDPDDPDTLTSTVTASVPAGTYYILVEGYDQSVTGDFHLDVTLQNGEGGSCDTVADCGAGLVCRVQTGASAKTCLKPSCSDMVDNDGDGKIDYPNEPGCDSPTDDDETDNCQANGSGCPACSDKKDNDKDGKIDFPDDPSCQSAGGTSEACTSVDPILTIADGSASGTLVGASNDFEPSCTEDAGASDQLYQLDLPATLTLDIDVESTDDNDDFFFPVTALLDATCGSAELGCANDEILSQTNLAAGSYFLVVDSAFPDEIGGYTVSVSGTVVPGQSCEGALFTSGALTCGGGSICGGDAGHKVCVPPQCSDGIDNNHDGVKDFPDDPGCTSPSDDTETTVCPGSDCPVCSNGSDDDGDGKKDYPADPDCESAAGSAESCVSVDPVAKITKKVTLDTLVGAHNDFELSCDLDPGGADRAYEITVPALTSFDAVVGETTDSSEDLATIALVGAACHGAELPTSGGDGNATCQKLGPTLHSGPLAAGTYHIVVDNDFPDETNTPFAYSLTVTGVAASGAACTSPLFAAGVLACTSGTTCTGGTCH